MRITSGKGSKQDYQSPSDFIEVVEYTTGRISFDLAASYHNRQSDLYFAKPGSNDPHAQAIDSLAQDWVALSRRVPPGSLLWLNPEWSNITPWARKCFESAPHLVRRVKIAFLVPASVGSNWFLDYVFEKSYTRFLNGRLTFVGHQDAYTKDCMFSLFGADVPLRAEPWKWTETLKQIQEVTSKCSMLHK